MKVLIISGFLGAGKTTFIKELVNKTKREYVIFENEFGDVNIDGNILKNHNMDILDDEKNNNDDNYLTIWESTSGCVCCSTKADFLSSLILIDNSLNPDFLLVEPSGVAFLSNIINNIKKANYDRIELLSPVAIVDATTYFVYKKKYKDILIDQIKISDIIQLSKIEGVSHNEIEAIKSDIHQINKNATVFIDNYCNQGLEYWQNLFGNELHIKDDMFEDFNIKKFDDCMMNFSYLNAYARDVRSVIYLLDCIIYNVFGEIDRAKGTFKSFDHYISFDLVNKKYEVRFNKHFEKNDVVFIGKNINKEMLEEFLNKMKKISN